HRRTTAHQFFSKGYHGLPMAAATLRQHLQVTVMRHGLDNSSDLLGQVTPLENSGANINPVASSCILSAA
ncbi:hypothetical protein PIB30_080866, partial [Stylosanthes scabra]|nr:hypothetical protein [Stylosanthes scabra]